LRILVDTSVWIDFFNGISSAPRLSLRNLLEAEEEVCISGYIFGGNSSGFQKQ
jgi:predicted nucleic acid-binding protein